MKVKAFGTVLCSHGELWNKVKTLNNNHKSLKMLEKSFVTLELSIPIRDHQVLA